MKILQRSLLFMLLFLLWQTAVCQATQPSFTRLTVEKDGTETVWSLASPETITMKEGETVTIRIYASGDTAYITASGLAGDWMYFSTTQGAGSATLMLLPEDDGEGDYTLTFDTFNSNLALPPATVSLPVHITDRNALTADDTEITVINYPNPVADNTTIEYVVPKDGKASLKLYSLSGREVASIFEKSVTAGRYFEKVNVSGLAAGSYVYRLTLDGVGSKSGRMYKL